MPVELITQAEYARRRGVDPTTVRDAIKAGRITLIEGKIDPAVADIQWQRNTRARVSASAPAAAPAPAVIGDIADDADYWVSRAKRERAEAELAELKLAEQRQELIRMNAVRAALASVFSATRDSLLQIAPRIAPVAAAETDAAKVHDLVQAEIHQALSQLTAAAGRLEAQP